MQQQAISPAHALGDRRRPLSTRELAGLLDLSESGVSKHLKQLVQSGMAVAEREGYFVMYRLTPDAISEFGNGVRKFLDLA